MNKLKILNEMIWNIIDEQIELLESYWKEAKLNLHLREAKGKNISIYESFSSGEYVCPACSNELIKSEHNKFNDAYKCKACELTLLVSKEDNTINHYRFNHK